MNHLITMARSAAPGPGVQFRRGPYGSDGIEEFLRDVLAIANASVDGPRFIIVGVEVDDCDQKVLVPVDRDDLSGKPAYQAIANEFIEPPVRIRYQPLQVEGTLLGVYEIGDCQDRPYMMRADFSATLRRGDAYARVNDVAMKMGRRQLQYLFEQKFRDSVSSSDIEVGFPGEIIHKDLHLPTCNLAELPSAIESGKLQELLEIQERARNSGSTTVLARLAHARLFGSDDPYVQRTPAELMEEMKTIRCEYRDQDDQFLFDSHAQAVQVVVYNQGEEAVCDASLSFVLPNHNVFYVAEQLPKALSRGKFVERKADDQARYPSVTLKDDAIHVATKVGDIPAGEPFEVFKEPLRVCAGNELHGCKFGIRYTLFGQNLRSPAKGKLRLFFK